MSKNEDEERIVVVNKMVKKRKTGEKEQLVK